MSIICPECKTKYYAAKLVKAGESFDNPPLIQDFLNEEYCIKTHYMCRKCYSIKVNDL